MGLQAITTSWSLYDCDSPVSLNDLKTNVRIVNDLVDSDGEPYSSDDAALTNILPAAVNYIEAETRQQISPLQYLLTMDRFPIDELMPARESLSFDRFRFERVIRLPKPPLQSIQSVQYLDPTGTLQTLGTDTYTVDTITVPGRIVLNAGQAWPKTIDNANSVRITFTAGYTRSLIPPVLRQAIMLLAGSWYEQRWNDITLRINSIPIGVQSIINQNMFPECVG